VGADRRIALSLGPGGLEPAGRSSLVGGDRLDLDADYRVLGPSGV
jgi:hypothetical protein